MLSWLTKQLISRVMAATRAGNIKPTLMLDAPDVRFVFPGNNSWSGEFNGRGADRKGGQTATYASCGLVLLFVFSFIFFFAASGAARTWTRGRASGSTTTAS